MAHEAGDASGSAYIALGKEDHIFPFIVEGDKPEDCFPKALKHSKLGGDIKKDGSPNIAFIKIVAGMLNVDFPELWNRYELEKSESNIICVDWKMAGVGSNSCGPALAAKYRIPIPEFSASLRFKPIVR